MIDHLDCVKPEQLAIEGGCWYCKMSQVLPPSKYQKKFLLAQRHVMHKTCSQTVQTKDILDELESVKKMKSSPLPVSTKETEATLEQTDFAGSL